mmetsp:Transcript_5670/g.10409  ORF Transcript_5670/g.10409 Transcript_5670/m.10409 type:complete len:531 (-) Transcript_5670:280-1872(-)
MCSYNSVNGVPTCLSSLQKAARDSWGFDGYVTSDSDAIRDAYASHKYVATGEEATCLALKYGGCDIDSGNTYYDHLQAGIEQKLCNYSDVDRALFNAFRVRFDLGLFDPVHNQKYFNLGEKDIGTDKSQHLNLDAALKSLVLLANPGYNSTSSVLPLQGRNPAIIGPHYNATKDLIQVDTGRVCPSGTFDCVTSSLQAIQHILGPTSNINYEQGCNVTDTNLTDQGLKMSLAAADGADSIILALGIVSCGGKNPRNDFTECEGHDRVRIDLPGAQKQLARAVLKLGKPTVIVLLNAGGVDFDLGLAEQDNKPAVIEAFYPGQMGGIAIAQSLYGLQNRWGKMPYTIYRQEWAEKHDMLDFDIVESRRTYRYPPFISDVLIPFGYGLSYTTFKLTLLGHHDTDKLNTNGSSPDLLFSIKVTNIGKMVGDEVLQAYLYPNDNVNLNPKPAKSLFSFKRVNDLPPGHVSVLSFRVNAADLLLVNANGDRVSAPGDYVLGFETGNPHNSPRGYSVGVKLVGDLHVYEPFPVADE